MSKALRLQAVQASGKTLELLEILAAGEDLHIGELAGKLQVSRNEVLLLLVTLESQGMVIWDARNRIYRSGWKMEWLARQFLQSGDSQSLEPVVASRNAVLAKEAGKTQSRLARL